MSKISFHKFLVQKRQKFVYPLIPKGPFLCKFAGISLHIQGCGGLEEHIFPHCQLAENLGDWLWRQPLELLGKFLPSKFSLPTICGQGEPAPTPVPPHSWVR
jgi:hypothetical protein